MLRGALDGPSLRFIPAKDGRGTFPREAISVPDVRVSGRDMPGREASGRDISGREICAADGPEVDRRLLSAADPVPPWFMPRPSTPPALGGRGTNRGATDPRSGIRILLFGAAARFGLFSAGRCAPRAFSFCALPIRALLFGTAARFGMFSVGRCTPRAPACALPMTGRSVFLPMPAVGEAGWNEPRLPAGGATWLTTGFANVLCGGTAAGRPALAPSIVVLVGFTSKA